MAKDTNSGECEGGGIDDNNEGSTSNDAVECDGSVPEEKPNVDNNVKNISKQTLIRQVLIGGVAVLPSIASGIFFGFLFADLPRSSRYRGDQLEYWGMEGFTWVALLFGSLLSGLLMDLVGRRSLLQLQCIPTAIGWIVTAYVLRDDIWIDKDNLQKMKAILYSGRIITALGISSIDATCQVYLSEISHPFLRGALSALRPLSFVFGFLLIGVLQHTKVPLCTLAFTTGVYSIITLIALCCIPESPVWLIAKRKCTEARRAKIYLDGANQSTDNVALREDNENEETGTEAKDDNGFFDHFVNLRKSMTIILFLVHVQMFSGWNAILLPAMDVMYTDIIWHSQKVIITIALIIYVILFVPIICTIVTFFNYKHLILVSGVGMSLSMLSLGIVSSLQREIDPYFPFHYLSCIYLSAISVGLYVIPWIIIGEIIPEKGRGFGAGVASALVYSLMFITGQLPFLCHIPQTVQFFIYSIISLLGSIFWYFYLPETQRKSLKEIEKMIHN